MGTFLEITIPVLNEEHRLEKGVRSTVDFCRSNFTRDFSLVIADNGSTDGTQRIAEGLCREFPGIVTYVKVPARGVGLALQTSWGRSESEIVGYMDVDLATDLVHLREVVEAFEDPSTMVINGSRLQKGARVEHRSPLREITSRVFNGILAVVLNVRFSDGMCGFKFLRRSVATTIIRNETTLAGWFFCTEILVKCEWLGIPVKEIPVRWTDDGDSRVKLFSLARSYLREIVRLARVRKAWRRKYAS